VIVTVGAHLLGGEVGVAASAVPLAGDGLGVEGGDDALLLADAVKQEARDVEVVTGLDTGAGANLAYGSGFRVV
jgi:hypothetical protein